MSVLYVVATPIGNLEDITLRAIRILKEVSLIAAEDTRKTRRLLDHYSIKTPMTSYFEHNKLAKLDYILKQLEGGDVALVSEAGMPGISDPGYELIRAVAGQGRLVVPIPGPSALVSALAVSALPTDRFLYTGFLPRKKGERRKLLESLAPEPGTLIFFETPHRLRESLGDIIDTLGDREMTVCRELTKFHEEVFRGKVSEVMSHFAEPIGEFTLVIAGNTERKTVSPEDMLKKLNELRFKGMKAKKAVAEAGKASGLSKREIYKMWLELKDSNETGGRS